MKQKIEVTFRPEIQDNFVITRDPEILEYEFKDEEAIAVTVEVGFSGSLAVYKKVLYSGREADNLIPLRAYAPGVWKAWRYLE
jgi:hypothetical protein